MYFLARVTQRCPGQNPLKSMLQNTRQREGEYPDTRAKISKAPRPTLCSENPKLQPSEDTGKDLPKGYGKSEISGIP